MQVTQIYSLMNDVTKEVLGETAVVNEDLSNVVDIGAAIFNANAMDGYVRSLVNHIGRVIFVNRPYTGRMPSVMKTAWEFGSCLEKVQADLPEATENESWELQNNTSYDPNVFYKGTVTAKFFNSKVTFEIPMSFTEKQVKQSFSDATQLNAFLSMLYNAVDKSMTVKIDSLIMRTVNNMIAETIYDDYGSAALSTASHTKAVNLLKLYNDKFGTSLSASVAINTPEFIRFASYMMGVYADRLTSMSTLFNIEEKERFTPRDLLHVVLLSDFANAAKAYLQSDTYHDLYTELPKHETVPFWQGSGTDYAFSSISAINVKTSGNHTVSVEGVIGVMFDHDALGVCNEDRRVTSNYNPKAEFYTNWYKFDESLFNDFSEQMCVFVVA